MRKQEEAMELNQARIEDAIVAEVASKIIGDDDLYGRVTRAVDARIDKHFREIADAQIAAAVQAAVTEGFERSYQKVDNFGAPIGPKTTIREELQRLIGDYWTALVDRQGKPTRDAYNATTRAEWMMTHLVAADFQGEMKQHVANLGGALKDKLRAELHETVNRLLSEVFRVRSVEDQGAKRSDVSVIDPPAKPLR